MEQEEQTDKSRHNEVAEDSLNTLLFLFLVLL